MPDSKFRQTKRAIEDIYDLEVKSILESLFNLLDVKIINDIISEHASLFDFAGILRLIRNLEDRDKVVNQTIKWFLFGKTRPSLKAFKVPVSLMGSLRIWKEPKKLVNKFFNIFLFS